MSTISNPFAAFADRHARKPRPRRVSEKEAARREKAAEERAQLSAAHRRWRKDQIAALLAGPHGAQALVEFLNSMDLQAEPELLEHVRSGPWHDADEDTRFLILVIIDAALVRLRERQGMPPFDDPLPGEAPSAFLELQEWLR
jgi:xanthine/CO dehydrogenase XdhC/CoxF family maturation factor